MKKIFVLLSLIVVFFACVWFLLPRFLNHTVTRILKENCSDCQLKMDNPSLDFFDLSRVTLRDLYFKQGDTSTLEVEVHAKSVELDIDLTDALKKNFHIRSAHIVLPDVKVTDGDKDDGISSQPSDTPLPLVAMDRIQIEKGHFEYHRILKGVHASLAVSEIHGVAKDVATRDAKTPATAKLECLFQGSGPHVLKLSSRPFAEPRTIDVDLLVHNQDMAGLSKFLMPNDGVELHGELVRGRGITQMTGDRLHSEVWAEYRDLKTKVHKADDRSPFAAFLLNLGTAITLKEKNVKDSADSKIRGVSLKREENESLVHFLLRGWKEAAMKVAAAPDTSKESSQ